MLEFDAVQVKKDLVLWIKEQMKTSGGKKAVIGISGGKDSSVVAALCVEALGKENVFGVLMPQGEQYDIQYSFDLVNHLGIDHKVVNIGPAVNAHVAELEKVLGTALSKAAKTNLPARVRMLTVYAVAQMENGGRVANTCNLSEDFVGYATKHGDGAGDFSPLSALTVGEVRELGKVLGLPIHLIEKTPEDGLSGLTDEDNLGFTYAVLDKYIRTGICEDATVKERIDTLNAYNKHKLELMPHFEYNPK